MELKYEIQITVKVITMEVLIVHLWNWNNRPRPAPNKVAKSFNRTFMELKFDQ